MARVAPVAGSRILTPSASPPTASNDPSGEKATLEKPAMVRATTRRERLDARSQIITAPSRLAEAAVRPSGAKATPSTGDAWNPNSSRVRSPPPTRPAPRATHQPPGSRESPRRCTTPARGNPSAGTGQADSPRESLDPVRTRTPPERWSLDPWPPPQSRLKRREGDQAAVHAGRERWGGKHLCAGTFHQWELANRPKNPARNRRNFARIQKIAPDKAIPTLWVVR